MRASVCVGGAEAYWELPGSEPDDRRWVGGGERTMYELAFALAQLGHDVELRGRICRAVYAELARATVRHPLIDAPRRRPLPGEVVLVLEGCVDPLVFGSIALSSARPVLVLLAPAGLFGWPFEPGWTLPDPLTVDLGLVGRPSSYQSMAAVGFELWANAPGIAAGVEAAGVGCHFVGQGTPGPPPALVDKTHDIAIVGGNRWEPLAREVLDGLPVRPLVTGAGPNDSVLAQLGAARLLVHPMRVEGSSRLAVEARLMGTVPVVLHHAYGAGFAAEDGVVALESIEEMRHAVVALLAEPDRVAALARSGVDFARRWRSWPEYLTRISVALENPPARHGAGARAEIGVAIDAVVGTAREEQVQLRRSFAEIEAHARALERDRDWLQRYIEDDLLVQIRDLSARRGSAPHD